jgi:transposase-like protein
MDPQENEAKARQRAQVILDVRSGKITATEGAALLGISRQSYYEWEHRALDGMTEALLDREAGRPLMPAADPEKEAMKKQMAEMERELEILRQTATIRETLLPFKEWQNKPSDPEKKRRK